MDTSTSTLFLFFVLVVIWHSHQVWTDPSAFIKRMQRIRSYLHKYSLGLFLPKSIKEGLDRSPESEILLARIMFVFIYLAIIYIAALSLS